MIRLYLSTCLLLSSIVCISQDISSVSFTGASALSSFSFKTEQGVIIKISDEGKILEWGTEMDSRQYGYFPGKLQQFMGRVDYFGAEADTLAKGKVKSIGTCMITYYGSFESEIKRGKLKTLGRLVFDYFSNYENEAFRGKLQFAGATIFNYYPSYENEVIKGKLKAVGNTQVTYYSTFDDKAIQGKIKTLGPNNYTWYISNDRLKGALKSGPTRPVINGVTYLLY